jgi:hypothetical protein
MRNKNALPPLPTPLQCQRFLSAVSRLRTVVRSEIWGADTAANADRVYELPEYKQLLDVACVGGFTHGDLSADGFDFDSINSQPLHHLANLPLAEIRRYIHALCRVERHNWGWASLVLAALQSGALEIAAGRLSGVCPRSHNPLPSP